MLIGLAWFSPRFSRWVVVVREMATPEAEAARAGARGRAVRAAKRALRVAGEAREAAAPKPANRRCSVARLRSAVTWATNASRAPASRRAHPASAEEATDRSAARWGTFASRAGALRRARAAPIASTVPKATSVSRRFLSACPNPRAHCASFVPNRSRSNRRSNGTGKDGASTIATAKFSRPRQLRMSTRMACRRW